LSENDVQLDKDKLEYVEKEVWKGETRRKPCTPCTDWLLLETFSVTVCK